MADRSRRLPVWVWLIAAPVLLFAAAWAGLGILLPPARVKQLVNEQLHTALRREVRFEDASVSLWPPVRLSVKNPQLAEPGGFAEGVAFGAESAELDLDVLQVLSKKLAVHRLTLVKPALHLVLRKDGSTNLDNLGAPVEPGAPPPAMDLDIREFSVRDGQVLVDDLGASRRIALGISTRLSLATQQGGQRIATSGETEIVDVAFGPASAARMSDLDQRFHALVWKIAHEGVFDAKQQRLALAKLALKLGRTDLVLSGIVDEPGPRLRYDLRARGDRVDLAEVLRWVAVADAKAVAGVTGRGELAFDLALRGGMPESGRVALPPTIVGSLRVKDGALRYPGAPAEVGGLSLSARFRPDSVEIRDLACTVSGQPVRAQLFATRFTDPLVRFALQGDIDLAAIAPLVAEQGAKVTGRTAVDVRGIGRANDPGTMALDGTAILKNVSVESKELPKKVEQVNGTVRFSPQRAEVKNLTANAGASSFAMDAMVTRPLALMAEPGKVAPAGVTFDFRSPHLDLAELLPTTPGAPFLPNAEGRGQVRIDRLIQGKLDVKSVAAQVVLAPAKLSAPSFSMLGYGGAVSGDASFDLTDTAKPVYAIHTVVKQVQADALLSAWTPVKGLIQGALDSNLEFSGRGDQPEDLKRSLTLVGLAAFSQGTIGPGPTLEAISQFVKIPALKQVKFQDLQLPLRVQNGRVISDPVKLAGSYGDWLLAGSVGFDGSLDYAVSVTLPPAVVAALNAKSALAAGGLSDDQGRMLLDLRLSGSARSPRVAWDTQAMRDRLAGRASAAITEQRAKLEAEAKTAAEQALREKLGLAGGDSTQRVPDVKALGTAARDSLKKAAGGLLEGFFKKPKPAPAPAPAPPSESAPADTSQH